MTNEDKTRGKKSGRQKPNTLNEGKPVI